MKVIILTGLDKAGKSTLKNEILKLTNRHIVVERFAADQYVYQGSYYKNKGKTTLSECLAIDSLLAGNACYVYVSANLRDIKQRMLLLKEDRRQFKTQNIYQWLERYREYFLQTSLPVLRINSSYSTAATLANKIVEFADKLEALK